MRSFTYSIFIILAVASVAKSAAAEDVKPSLEWHLYGDTYYSYNFNRPAPVPAASATSVSSAALPDARNTYRYYDTYHNQFTLNQVEFSVLAKYGEVAFLTDLDFGPFADLNAASGSSSAGTKTVDEVSKHVGQAVISYRAQGSRFSMDVGKMYSHIGLETVKAKDNFNYSRSVLFGYGMPFWHTGLRAGYDIIPEKFQANLYVYNSWNSLYDNNNSKSVGLQLKYAPSSFVTFIYNYLGGPERSDSEKDKKTLHEFNTTWVLSNKLSIATDLLYGEETNATVGITRTNAKWYGGLVTAKYALSESCYISPRFEIFRDPQGYILSGGAQTIRSGTLTYGHALTKGLDMRAEGRWDSSVGQKPFTKGLIPQDSQTTFLAALLFTY